MKLTVLSDNESGPLCAGEHGLSFLIEVDTTVLLDTGASELFLENAKKLNVDLDTVNDIVLSHGHWDHGNGLKFINNRRLICHPGSFVKRYRKRDRSYIGLDQSFEELQANFEIIRSKNPFPISGQIIFLGEIPRINAFESKRSTFMLEDGSDDFVIDDSALAVTSENGLIVISGCAHSGICNTIDYARKITGIDKVYAAIGGFHLQRIDSSLEKTIRYLKENQVQKVIPCHCVVDEVKAVLHQEFDSMKIFAGAVIDNL